MWAAIPTRPAPALSTARTASAVEEGTIIVAPEGRSPLRWPPALPSTHTLVITALGVVAVGLAAVGGWAWWDALERRTETAVAEVMARVQPAQAPDAAAEARLTAIRELEQLLQRYPSARTVPATAYELGNLRFATGQYAAARAAYDLALQRGATGLVAALSRGAIARTWEAERDYSRAADAYAALVQHLDARSFLFEDALIDQARVLELAGKKAEAIAAYQRVLKEIPGARRADDVRTRLASLGTASR
jgi:tetratricopeptide (TPR) repeat protein